MAYFLKASYFDPEKQEKVFKIHQVTETTKRNHGKAKVKKMQAPGLKIGLNLADFAPSEGPTTPDEWAHTRFIDDATKKEFAIKCGVDLAVKLEKRAEIEEPMKPKDNPTLREELKNMDLPGLRSWCEKAGWNEEEYKNFRNAGLLLEKIIQRSLTAEVVNG